MADMTSDMVRKVLEPCQLLINSVKKSAQEAHRNQLIVASTKTSASKITSLEKEE